MVKLWIAAVAGAVVAVLTHVYARLPLSSISTAVAVSLAFGIVNFGVASALGAGDAGEIPQGLRP